MFVTLQGVNVWTGTTSGGNAPAGTCTRADDLDPAATITVEAG